MKKILFISLFLQQVCFSQTLKLNNNTVTINSTGISTGSNFRVTNPDHLSASFLVSGADTINGASPGVIIPIAARYIWAVCAQSTSTLILNESNNYTLSNDTITYNNGDGDMNLIASISIAIATSEDYEFRWFNITDNTICGSPQAASSSAITNITNILVRGYDINANTLDKYVLQIRNLSSAADPFLYYLDAFLEMKEYD